MSAQSDAQQSRDAHLKQAFEKHLPRRIASVQRRTMALCEGGWDINTLHLIYSEVQQLAGSAGSYGMVSASERLFALEVYLSSFTETGLIPDAGQTAEVERIVGELDEISGGAQLGAEADTTRRVTATVVSSMDMPEPIIELNGLPSPANVPNMVVPPLDFLPFDELPQSPLGELVDDAANESDSTDEDGEGSPYIDPDIERMIGESGEVSVGDIADRIISGEDQLNALSSDDVGDSWKDDVDRGASSDQMVIHSVDSLAELEGEEYELDAGINTEQIEKLTAASEAEASIEDEPQKDARTSGDRNKTVTLSKARTVYFLRTADPVGDALVQRLEPEYEVHSFDDVDEFREILGALGPDVVMIGQSFIGEIDGLGPLIKRIRSKQSGPMPMLAFSDEKDVATRLKILRAGADGFFNSDAPAEQVRQRLAELMQAQSEDPFRILIVEDDRSQAMFAQSILKKAGMQVYLERSALKIMDALEKFHPDLILMDLYMPDCDGIELTAIVRERDEFVNTPIVFLSGEADTDKHFDALLAGGDDFLAKPIRPRHLIQAVTNRVQRARQLQRRGGRKTTRDTLTGLVERPILLERINALLADMDKVDRDLPGGLLFVEIDHPMALRRDVGLAEFEQLTDLLAPLLTEELGKGEAAGRYGDNAYCILIPNRSLGALEALAQDLVTRVSKHFFQLPSGARAISISIGICMLSTQLADAGAAISAAERACNVNVDRGNSRVAKADVGDSIASESETDADDEAMLKLIEDALENRRFQVLYQPIVSLQGDHNEQYQALLRLPGRDGKPLAASKFIPVAERSGAIVKIDRWVVSRALSVIDERSRDERPLRLFINQSGATVEQRENLPWLQKLISTRGVDPDCLVLEFKLPDIIKRLKAAVAFNNSLVSMGVKAALGGFDGSPAAFQVLDHLKVNYVKLPPASGNSPALGANIKDTVDQLHALDKLVIIPSIEDAKTAARLWPTGVDFIQGNFVQQPEAELVYQF